MRFGVVGTSFWAREVHATGINAAAEAELVGVWGRDPAKTRELAEAAGATAYDDFRAMLDDVDAVSFSVPPHVQAELALTAVCCRSPPAAGEADRDVARRGGRARQGNR